jgi:hypothetical protein
MDVTILEKSALVGAQVDNLGNVVESRVQHLEDSLMLCFQQQAERIMKRIGELSGRAADQHSENDRRMDDLSSILPGPLEQLSGPPNIADSVPVPEPIKESTFPEMTVTVVKQEVSCPDSQTKPRFEDTKANHGSWQSDTPEVQISVEEQKSDYKPAFQEALHVFSESRSGQDKRRFDIENIIAENERSLQVVLAKLSEKADHSSGVLSKKITSKLGVLRTVIKDVEQISREAAGLMWAGIRMVLNVMVRFPSGLSNRTSKRATNLSTGPRVKRRSKPLLRGDSGGYHRDARCLRDM